ncbi:hypothetical protein RR46_13133 [Papilio xuthus]|uniref:Uncharacterized protein n=1 Tax=Papilio xuthus TaxID=66420 RepID=A0A194PLV1_PAPXU|nr:hypothetical protein RR46_13133 [Papilio xuthus]
MAVNAHKKEKQVRARCRPGRREREQRRRAGPGAGEPGSQALSLRTVADDGAAARGGVGRYPSAPNTREAAQTSRGDKSECIGHSPFD